MLLGDTGRLAGGDATQDKEFRERQKTGWPGACMGYFQETENWPRVVMVLVRSWTFAE